MTLSARLQQAKTQRLIEAGLLSSEHALKPEGASEPEREPDLPDEARGLFEPITVEVMSSGLHVVSNDTVDLTSLSGDELANTCPKCNAVGHVDMVDLVGHTTHLTCSSCGTMWQVRQHDDASASG